MLFILHAANEISHRNLSANFVVCVGFMLGKEEFEGPRTWA